MKSSRRRNVRGSDCRTQTCYTKKGSVIGKRNEVSDAYRFILAPDAKAVADEFAGDETPARAAALAPRNVGHGTLKTWIEKLISC